MDLCYDLVKPDEVECYNVSWKTKESVRNAIPCFIYDKLYSCGMKVIGDFFDDNSGIVPFAN